MAHSYVSCLVHCVFSTKERRQTISDDLRDRLYAYMGGIARRNGARPLAIGGTSDHVHLLVSMPSTEATANMIQRIKGASARWVHDTFPTHRSFGWQEGYGAFSIGISQAADTIKYIEDQAEHHKARTFEE
ncbi:MAG: IS200/IS605 family transposase, partial [Candidatus Brocadiae bacterium]|nr:IS200/IS605 family transposase [Candidatus Brocadiia bacterium]